MGNAKQAGIRPAGVSASRQVTWHAGSVTGADRSALTGQTGCVVWLTGLSGSGKSTLARLLERRLTEQGRLAYVLDGDNVRCGLNRDLGFSPRDREENIRRVGEVAALLADAGLVTIAALISPYRAARRRAREAAGNCPFLEVFLDAPLAECRRRDPKGLYAKARAGQVAGLTGVDAPYERPEAPDLVLDTGQRTPAQCAARVMACLRRRGLLPAPPPRARKPRRSLP